jgi:hypothetical protein
MSFKMPATTNHSTDQPEHSESAYHRLEECLPPGLNSSVRDGCQNNNDQEGNENGAIQEITDAPSPSRFLAKTIPLDDVSSFQFDAY